MKKNGKYKFTDYLSIAAKIMSAGSSLYRLDKLSYTPISLSTVSMSVISEPPYPYLNTLIVFSSTAIP